MSNVVTLPVKPRKVNPSPAPDGTRYYCLRCDAEWFVILGTGRIHCSVCNAMMGNLFAEKRHGN